MSSFAYVPFKEEDTATEESTGEETLAESISPTLSSTSTSTMGTEIEANADSTPDIPLTAECDKNLSIEDIKKSSADAFKIFDKLLSGQRSRHAEKENSKHNRNQNDFVDSKSREIAANTMLQIRPENLDVDKSNEGELTAWEIIKKILPAIISKPTLSGTSLDDPHSPLMVAIAEGNLKDLKALLNETDSNGYILWDPNHYFEHPFNQNCLELACERNDGKLLVEALLKAGADPNIPNSLTQELPIHITCRTLNFSCLELLVKHHADVNYADQKGNTPLHILIEGTQDLNKNDKEMMFRHSQCFDILIGSDHLNVNKVNEKRETPLSLVFKYRLKNDLLKIMLDQKHTWDAAENVDDLVTQDIERLTEDIFFENEDEMVIQGNLVTRSNYKKIFEEYSEPGTPNELLRKSGELFELLYRNESSFVDEIRRTYIHGEEDRTVLEYGNKICTLLQHAAKYGKSEAVNVLLQSGVDPNYTIPENPSPPIVLAASNKNSESMKFLLSKDGIYVDNVDDKGDTALHIAARCGNLKSVVLLLRHGADINIRNKLGKLPFDRKQLQKLLDLSMTSNEETRGNNDYTVYLDYSLLTTKQEKVQFHEENVCRRTLDGEMDFLYMMSRNKELSELLRHPIPWSFLHMKWKKLKYFCYINLAFYTMFVIFLNAFIITCKHHEIQKLEKLSAHNLFVLVPLAGITMMFWSIFVGREMIELLLNPNIYREHLDNCLDLGVLVFSFLAVVLPFVLEASATSRYIMNYVNILAIILSFMDLLIDLGRIPHLSIYIEMLKVVIKSFIFPFLYYGVIIIAFALCFHTIYHETVELSDLKYSNSDLCPVEEVDDNFGSWYLSLVRALVMMTGELDYDSFPRHSPIAVTLFVFFVLLVTIVLMNLLTGVAVSDTQKIEKMAELLQLQTRVSVVYKLEQNVIKWFNREVRICCPWFLRKVLAKRIRHILCFKELQGEKRGEVKPNLKEKILKFKEDEIDLDEDQLNEIMKIVNHPNSRRSVTLAHLDTKIKYLLNILTK